MTFKEIKQGHTVYILDKERLTLSEGRVTQAAPHLGGTLGTYTQAQGQLMVDVTIEADGKAQTYTIPETLAVTFANNIVLATTQQGLSGEVQRMKSEAERILASVDRQKEIVNKAGGLLAELNPQYKEKQETERRFGKIEESVNGIQSMIKQLLDKLE